MRALAIFVLAAVAAMVDPPGALADSMPPGVRVFPTGSLGMEAAALLMSGQQGGMLPIAVVATPVGISDGRARVMVVVEVAGAPLFERATASPLYLELCLYALATSGDGGAEGNAGGGAVLASLLETVELDLDQVQKAVAAGGLRIVRELTLPPGETSLRVLVRSKASGTLGLRVVPLQVPAASAPASLLTGDAPSPGIHVVVVDGPPPASGWPAFVDAPAGGATAPRRTAQARGRRRGALRGLETSYRTALASVVDEGVATAAVAVAELESRLLAEIGADKLALAEAELEVLAALAKVDAGALPTVLELYLEVARYAGARRSTLLAAHARDMILQVAELFAASDAPGSRDLASNALLAFVGAAPAWEARLTLTRMLEAALEHQPQNQNALLLAAVDAEIRADHPTAIARLEALQQLAPDLPEVQLRLGVNHVRAGESRRAATTLGKLLAAPAAATTPPPWWLPVAHQELARAHLAAGRDGEAEKVLRRGLARLPGEEKLSLQLALLLAERRQRAQAQAVLVDLVPAKTDRGYDSARHRYTQLPEELLLQAVDALRSSAESARPRLGAALGATSRPAEGR